MAKIIPLCAVLVSMVHTAAASGTTTTPFSYEMQTATPSMNLTFSTLTNYTYTSYPSQTPALTSMPPPRPANYSEEAWSFLWMQVGPVQSPPFNSTVSPTPVASHVPPPLGFDSQITYGNLSSAKLPSDFIWGVADAAYQCEGAVKAEGRGPSIWDLLTHRVPGYVVDGATGDIADLFYYTYPQDIARLASFGIPYFYMSIAWSRIFPFGKGYVNEEGLKHYDHVFQTMQDYGVKPVVALFHWDTPLALMNEYNGWVSEEIVADFLAYAQLIMTRWDKYVPIWITVNEPQVYCSDYDTYPSGYWPQYGYTGLRAQYACGHNTLLAHAAVSDWYRNVFNGTGRISFKNSGGYNFANSTSSANNATVKRAYDFDFGWFNSPVWLTGDYPTSMRDTLGDLLPNFTHAQSAMILNSCDFFAIDGYSSSVVYPMPGGIAACAKNKSNPEWPSCAPSSQVTWSGWDVGFAASDRTNWLKAVPKGLRLLLGWLQDTYTGPKGKDIILSEFGFAVPFEGNRSTLADALYDQLRIDYFTGYLNAMLAARIEDGVNVTGSLAWGAFDDFEWTTGYLSRFGLQYVNYTTLERFAQASMFTFTDFFKQHMP